MGADTHIEWATHTFNPWEGCQKVGPGCDNCYAEARDIRFTGGTHWGPGAPRRRTSPANWAKPLKWNRDAAKSGTRPRVFCASLADVFDNAVDPAWRTDLWALIRSCPNLDWLLLTKRPGNIAAMLPPDWGDGWRHVWLGCTVVNQEEVDRDIPKLLAVPARVRLLCVEPMLGAIDLLGYIFIYTHADEATLACDCQEMPILPFNDPDTTDPADIATPRVDWVICGGESGLNARPMHPDWTRSLRDQCFDAGVPFFFKQWGAWLHESQDPDGEWDWCDADDRGILHHWPDVECVTTSMRLRKSKAGRLLDGRTWDEVPG